MARAARLLELLIRLRATPRLTAQELADHFEVSRRTMLRDLRTLSDLGVPLVATAGPGGGYRLARDQRVAPLALTANEALGVLLSYEAFLRYAQSPFAAENLSAITKLRATLVLATFTIRDNFLALAVQDCQDLATDGESSQHTGPQPRILHRNRTLRRASAARNSPNGGRHSPASRGEHARLRPARHHVAASPCGPVSGTLSRRYER